MVPTSSLQSILAFMVQVAASGPPAVSAGPLDGAVLSLFTNSPPTFAANPVPGDLVDPAYTGYTAAQAITWGTPFVNPLLQAEVSGGIFNFAVTASGTPNIITGAGILNSAGTHILGLDIFATPITLTNTFDGFTYYCRWVLQGL